MAMNELITVETTVKTSLEKAWGYWNKPEHITRWAVDSDDWEVSYAENDLRVGGKFVVRTRKKAGSEQVDFTGIYTNIEANKRIDYDLQDGRHVSVEFEETTDGVRVKETFESEKESGEDGERASWLATLKNFKAYVESR